MRWQKLIRYIACLSILFVLNTDRGSAQTLTAQPLALKSLQTSQEKVSDLENQIKQFSASLQGITLKNSASVGNIEQIGSFYSPDAHLMPPDEGYPLIQGRTKILDYWQRQQDASFGIVFLMGKDVDPKETLAVDTGRYQIYAHHDATAYAVDGGEFVIVWKHDGSTWSVYRQAWYRSPPRESLVKMKTIRVKETMSYNPKFSNVSIREEISNFLRNRYETTGIANHQGCGALCVHSSIDQMKEEVLADPSFRQRLEIRTHATPIPIKGTLEIHLSLEGWYRQNDNREEERSMERYFYEQVKGYSELLLSDLVAHLTRKLDTD